MASMHSRRALVRGVAGTGIIASIAGSAEPSSVAGAQTNGVSSGGIGLSRTEWQQIYGPGEATQNYGAYVDPMSGGPIYVGFDFVNFDDGLLDFLEIHWSQANAAGGISEDDADSRIQALLPGDAQMQETFFMGATPGGPIALRSQRWSSSVLAQVTNGRSSLLVTYQEKTGQLPGSSGIDFIVTTATIAVQEE